MVSFRVRRRHYAGHGPRTVKLFWDMWEAKAASEILPEQKSSREEIMLEKLADAVERRIADKSAEAERNRPQRAV